MHRISVRALGPIRDCEITLNRFMVLTGPQAHGKSTLAKAVFFFRTVQEDILDLLRRGIFAPSDFRIRLEWRLRDKFQRLFGPLWDFPMEAEIEYHYNDETWMRIWPDEKEASTDRLLRFNAEGSTFNSASRLGPHSVFQIRFSANVVDYFRGLPRRFAREADARQLMEEETALHTLFSDPYRSVFIPAGREMIALLTDQLNYIFTSMGEDQRSGIDYCTERYVTEILRLKHLFPGGIDGLLTDELARNPALAHRERIETMRDRIGVLLKGAYQYSGQTERIVWEEDRQMRRVNLNFASSGQQEMVWITNLLFYYLTKSRPVFLILEEPESHLYPDAQKQMTELLALFGNGGNAVLMTTHSPYMLGTLNNLIYAWEIDRRGLSGAERVIEPDLWLDAESVSAWHVKGGTIQEAKEPELGLIRNEYIEGASEEILRQSDALYELSAQADHPQGRV